MSRTFKFSKGSLEVGETRVSGSIKASTSMQQAPDNLAIDTAIENFGPISINEVKQFRYTLSFVGFIMVRQAKHDTTSEMKGVHSD